jgi:hypothetical protein
LTIVGNNTGSTANLAVAARAIGTAGIKPVVDRTFGFVSAIGEVQTRVTPAVSNGAARDNSAPFFIATPP